MQKKNLLDVERTSALPEEMVEVLYSRGAARIERIVSRGQVSPPGFWYDQAEDEYVVVLQGEGRIQYADGAQDRLGQGDALCIPAHRRHRVCYTSSWPPCVWLCVFVR